jgi:hypothetical protein
MMDNITFRQLDLQLFAEGAGDGGSGTGAEGATGDTAAAAVQQTKCVESNPLADVVYSMQGDSAQNATVQETAAGSDPVQSPDRAAEFEKLIKGEYKDLYDQRVQDTIQRRLKGSKEVVDKYNALTPMFEMLARKYGVEATDTEALMKAIEEDDAYYEEEALEKGVTVEQLKEIKKMERENADLRRQMQEENAKKKGAQLYAQWMDQAKKAKAVYPSFDLRAEMNNPKFVELLRANIDVRTAYEVVHKDDIIPAAMQFTAQAVEQKITNKIRANGARPTENGLASQGAAQVKSDVSQLTKDDLAEVARRVARGERISFG